MMRLAAFALFLGAAPAALLAAASPSELPEPALSRALDAVLIPVDDMTRDFFGLAAEDTGALVLAVAQGGIAEVYGIKPGDVVAAVSEVPFALPDEIDSIVWAFLNNRTFDFVWAVRRDGALTQVAFPLVLSHFQESYLVSDIGGWPSWGEWSNHSSQSWPAYASAHADVFGANIEGAPVCSSCTAPGAVAEETSAPAAEEDSEPAAPEIAAPVPDPEPEVAEPAPEPEAEPPPAEIPVPAIADALPATEDPAEVPTEAAAIEMLPVPDEPAAIDVLMAPPAPSAQELTPPAAAETTEEATELGALQPALITPEPSESAPPVEARLPRPAPERPVEAFVQETPADTTGEALVQEAPVAAVSDAPPAGTGEDVPLDPSIQGSALASGETEPAPELVPAPPPAIGAVVHAEEGLDFDDGASASAVEAPVETAPLAERDPCRYGPLCAEGGRDRGGRDSGSGGGD